MPSVSLEIRVPEDLLAMRRKSRADMEREAQAWVALELFRRREVSAGKAAELAAMPLADFMDLTRQRGVDWTDYTEEEIAEEVESSLTLASAVKGTADEPCSG